MLHEKYKTLNTDVLCSIYLKFHVNKNTQIDYILNVLGEFLI